MFILSSFCFLQFVTIYHWLIYRYWRLQMISALCNISKSTLKIYIMPDYVMISSYTLAIVLDSCMFHFLFHRQMLILDPFMIFSYQAKHPVRIQQRNKIDRQTVSISRFRSEASRNSSLMHRRSQLADFGYSDQDHWFSWLF